MLHVKTICFDLWLPWPVSLPTRCACPAGMRVRLFSRVWWMLLCRWLLSFNFSIHRSDWVNAEKLLQPAFEFISIVVKSSTDCGCLSRVVIESVYQTLNTSIYRVPLAHRAKFRIPVKQFLIYLPFGRQKCVIFLQVHFQFISYQIKLHEVTDLTYACQRYVNFVSFRLTVANTFFCAIW